MELMRQRRREVAAKEADTRRPHRPVRRDGRRCWWCPFLVLPALLAGCAQKDKYGWPRGQLPWAVSWRTVVLVVTWPGGRTLARVPLPSKWDRLYGPLSWSSDGRLLALNLWTQSGPQKWGWRGALWDLRKNRLSRLPPGLCCWQIRPRSNRLLGTWNGKVVETAFDGSKRRVISSPPLYVAAWSPNGDRLAAIRKARKRYELVLLNAEGGLVRVLHSWDARMGGSGFGFGWSPDGKRIAFSRWRKDSLAIYMISDNGGKAQRVLEGRDASWSPDGKRLAYVAVERNDLSTAVWVAEVHNWRGRRLPLATPWATFPAWAPDGRRLATLVSEVQPLSYEDTVPPPGQREWPPSGMAPPSKSGL